jgi:multiple sugar transport system substrate-binding protein
LAANGGLPTTEVQEQTLTAPCRLIYSITHICHRSAIEPFPVTNVENTMSRRSQTPNPKSEIAYRQPPTTYRLLVYCLLVFLAGCPEQASKPSDAQGKMPLTGVKLRLLVVDDLQLAAVVGQLRGEWNTLTGSDFQIKSISEKELFCSDRLAADVVICPACLLGPLAERRLITPMPKEMHQDQAADSSNIFELLRIREAVWAADVLAVPFGSPVLTCYYRADLLKTLGRKPPRSWAEYQELATLLADRNNLGNAAGADDTPWSGTIEPLGPGWAGLVLLARAAPYAKHRDNYSTLFDINTMQPLVAGPPFVRALEELVAAAKLGSPDQLDYDPTATRAAFWQGQCGMALSWPTRAPGGLPAGENAGLPTGDLPTGATGGLPTSANVADDVQVGFAELPGSTQVYNVGNQSWETRAEQDSPHVPLLGIAGRIGVVGDKSDHPRAAFLLLRWLSGEQFSPQVCTASSATTLFRRSHVKAPQVWVEKPISPPAAIEYGTITEAALLRRQWLFAPRIPARSEYVSALDEAVHQAVRGEKSPAEALQWAAARWGEVTERLGPERQKAAYLHSLGLE